MVSEMASDGKSRRVHRMMKMTPMRTLFEWDPRKGQANRRKHGVTFDEACTVFNDPLAAIFEGQDHSTVELREILIGRSVLNRLVLVCIAEQPGGEVRLISARRATKRGQNDYEAHRKG